MLIKEYRIPLPLTVQEYQIGQLFTVTETSKNETGGGEGVEVLANEPFINKPIFGNQPSSGQYTYKIYHLKEKVPALIKLMAPRGALQLHEESWNAYPFCKTIVTNPSFKERFSVIFESFHLPDKGTTENALNLPPEILAQREVVLIDVANDDILPGDYRPEYDPTKFHSVRTGRGPYFGDWINQQTPMMTCYKYLSVEFKWFGLQTRVEGHIHRIAQRLFTLFHRQLLCTIDQWIGLSLNDIRLLEAAAKEELNKQRQHDGIRGMSQIE
ncbi:Phosphatidylinositol transfer protein [Nesidiocoris tenuis]|uniref:Phosphatidylinositol transfer protein n=1 Tax=Nesidiocoris tenuis TaxID=355587 RepID=A0ABN7AQJ4_9HEMI|nr:Phosphatidylinositol transfer protein [Nesidiocoris tenuis]